MQELGVVYAATGERCRREAIRSATSLKRHNPSLPVTLFSDAVLDEPCFDEVRQLEECSFSYIDKIAPLADSPYERTLFLDSDTFICDNVGELFPLLDRFQLAAAHDTWRLGEAIDDCPASFFEFNTGVLLYRNEPAVRQLIEDWKATYLNQLAKGKDCNDQSSFRSVIYQSELDLYVLGAEYNFTTWCPGFAGARARVKILHGKNPNLDEIATWLNASRQSRSFVPFLSDLNPQSFGILTARGQRVLKISSLLSRLRKRQ